jgi:hypothetical protein
MMRGKQIEQRDTKEKKATKARYNRTNAPERRNARMNINPSGKDMQTESE